MEGKFAIIAFFVIGIIILVGSSIMLGIGGCGPTKVCEILVVDKHIDISGSKESTESNYLVTTELGVFEVDNGILLGMWNADELYGQIQVGKRYRITSQGNRYQNFLIQEFPYITKVEPL